MLDTYGVTVTRNKKPGIRREAGLFRANSPDGALAKALLHFDGVDSVRAESLGNEDADGFADKHWKWTRELLDAGDDVLIGGYLED